jgi:hypothetical protein
VPKDWAGLAESFASAAQGLQSAEGPAIPEAPAAPSAAELKACASRPAALVRSERSAHALQAIALRLAETRVFLRDRRAFAKAAEDTWQALVKTLAALPADPATEALFPTRWGAQDLGVLASLVNSEQALDHQEERLERVQVELHSRASSITALAGGVERARDCALAGQWTGTISAAGAVQGVSVDLVADPAGWTGTANVYGKRCAVRGVTAKATAWTITLEIGCGTITAVLGADQRSLSGSFSSSEGPARINLVKR